MKTILKLYPNGDFETVDTPLVQSGMVNNYKFAENTITVPQIIEYPPNDARNYYIEKTTVSGYILSYVDEGIAAGTLHPANEHDRTSDFIDVRGWDNGIVRAVFENIDGSYLCWMSIITYDASKRHVGYKYDYYVPQKNPPESTIFEHTFNADIAYIRISVNFYDHPTAIVKMSVQQGTVATQKHYLAPEDLPSWAIDTGHPVSIFPEGIVTKGNLIQS